MNKHSEVLTLLSKGSDTQIDETLKARFIALSEKEDLNAEDVIKVLDDCVHYALCSGFVINVLDFVWRDLGGSPENRIGNPNPAERKRNE